MSKDEIQERIEYGKGKRIVISVPSINPFVKKMDLTSKRYVCLVGLFLQETLLILITYHLRNEMKNKHKALTTFIVLRFENVNM